MNQYLQRYLDGEYKAVWNELLSAGEEIRTEHLEYDAETVLLKLQNGQLTTSEQLPSV